LEPLIGNGDVSIKVKNSWAGRKTIDNQSINLKTVSPTVVLPDPRWIQLILYDVRNLSCKFELFLPSGSWYFEMTQPYFCNFFYYLYTATLKKTQEIWIPFSYGWFVPIIGIKWLVLEKNFVIFLLFRYYLSLQKDVSLQLNKRESHFVKSDLCQFCLQLAQWLRRSRKYYRMKMCCFCSYCMPMTYFEVIIYLKKN
jgi:hypothetical protein